MLSALFETNYGEQITSESFLFNFIALLWLRLEAQKSVHNSGTARCVNTTLSPSGTTCSVCALQWIHTVFGRGYYLGPFLVLSV